MNTYRVTISDDSGNVLDAATGRLLDERRRLVGVTFTDRSNCIVASFSELETALAL